MYKGLGTNLAVALLFLVLIIPFFANISNTHSRGYAITLVSEQSFASFALKTASAQTSVAGPAIGITAMSSPAYDFYKQIDVTDFLKYLIGRYSEHTAKCYMNYFDRYGTIFFSANPHVELLKLLMLY